MTSSIPLPNSNNNHPYIPSQAFLYFPPNNEVKDSTGQRLIFEGNTQLDAEELHQIEAFKNHLIQHNEPFHPSWTDALILRMLYASNFKMAKTLTTLVEYDKWRHSALPVQMDPELEDFLNSGLLYISGRDHRFRPILVMRLCVIDPKKVDLELVKRAFTFWFDHIINEWTLPGQIENWDFIIDAEDVKISHKSLQSITKVFKHLQDNYKCRLNTLSIVNAPSSVYVSWKLVKNMLDDVTVKKINFSKSSIPEKLFNIANREQVERKYGGSAPDITHYWPPKLFSNNFFVKYNDSSALISTEEYLTRHQNGSLRNMTVNQDLTGSPKSSETSNSQNQQSFSEVLEQRPASLIDNSLSRTTENTPEGGSYDSLGSQGFESVSSIYAKQQPLTPEFPAPEENIEADYEDLMDEEVSGTKGGMRQIKDFEALFLV